MRYKKKAFFNCFSIKWLVTTIQRVVKTNGGKSRLDVKNKIPLDGLLTDDKESSFRIFIWKYWRERRVRNLGYA